jgi:phosphoglycolate phosphatase-like HAD superfamily hydrolase
MNPAKLSRAWDAYDAYLFDIDGTLMNCTDAVHYFAFNEALTSVGGRPLTIDGVVAHGNTDVGIIRDAFAKHEVAESLWRPQLAEMIAGMGRFVESRQGDLCINLLPRVRDVLLHLKARGAVIGTATGNLQAIGEVKLARAGLLELFDFGGWSDAHETRTEVFRAAAAKARELAGRDAKLCVLGDTPADVRAARDIGVEVIAVATGIYPFEQLQAESPNLLLHSLEELMLSAV